MNKNQSLLKATLALAIPISLQSFLMSSRNIVDVMMLSQLGSAETAAMGLSLRAVMVASLFLGGICGAGAIFTAQNKGKADTQGMMQSTCFAFSLSFPFALLCSLIYFFYNQPILNLATDDNAILHHGESYLAIASLAFPLMAIIYVFASGLRAISKVKTVALINSIGLLLNIALNYLFIFGHFGAPEMGIKGAAIGTLVSAIVEASLLLIVVYYYKQPVGFGFTHLKNVFSSNFSQERAKYFKVCLPLALNAIAWPAAMFIYHSIFGHLSSDALAAMSLVTPIETYCLALMAGIGSAASVIMGETLGKGDMEIAYQRAWWFIRFNAATGVLIAFVTWLLKDWVINLSPALSTETINYASQFYNWLLLAIVLKSISIAMVIGVLRPAGDTRFCLSQDLVAQWLVTIPVVFAAAVMFKLPAHWVFALLLTEEVIKIGWSCKRIISKRWLKPLV